jgi:2,3-bisphosphoglycerate-independent phosphoglycerate mutase
MDTRKVILIVRDGWGYSEEKEGNATYMANTPNDDYYRENYPSTLLNCTGRAVGLPEGTQGGSEPGHLTMGAGRVVWQPLEEINRSIKDGSFYRNPQFLKAINYCRKQKGKLHLAGLLSDQGIHGTTSHLFALLKLAKKNEFHEVFIHCFLDGRDVPERSAKIFLQETEKMIKKLRVGVIASLIGRYYAMDRDSNWNRTKKAYDLLTLGKGKKYINPVKALEETYDFESTSDYYIKPIVIVNCKQQPLATVNDGDSFILWNFRSDRARQITDAFTQRKLVFFNRQKIPQIYFVGMNVYDQTKNVPAAFLHPVVKNNLGIVLSKEGLRQLRIAETEKYAQVTFFFNSQVEESTKGEERILIPSLKNPSYEEKPEMRAYEITNKLVSEIKRNRFDFILVNYANGDLVGHSANLQAAITACEIVDDCVGKVVETGLKEDYTILLAGDHGNVETMFYSNKIPNPSHGTNKEPFYLISKKKKLKKIKLENNLGLSSVAPTVLELMEITKPEEMTGKSLLRWK